MSDVEGLFNHGVGRDGLRATSLDNKGIEAAFYHSGPGRSADADYQRYPRWWDHDPVSYFDDGTGAGGENIDAGLILPRLFGIDGGGPAAGTQPQDVVQDPALFPDGTSGWSDELPFLTQEQLPYREDFAVLFGWWATDTDGALTKVGEYQDLDSAPFLSLDGLFSDGERTVDLFARFLDKETSKTNLDYYGPGFSAKLGFQRFLHRLDNDPLTNLDTPFFFSSENLNAGEDFAIRIEEVEARFKGNVTEKIKWRVDFWAMRKHGERQVRGMQMMAFPCGNCHITGARQRIDWLTTEIEPVLEGKFGPVSVEYSRPMQSFSQGDQLITQLGDGTQLFSEDLPYGFVPENFTQIDRLKLNVNLMRNSKFSANLFVGDTRNKHRDTRRRFNGIDLQLTNQSFDNRLTLTAYGKRFNEENQVAPFLVVPEEQNILSRPIDYERTVAGVRSRWRPFLGRYSVLSRLSINSGYEYRLIERGHAVFPTDTGPVYDQRQTNTHSFHVGPSLKWSPELDSYVRYKMQSTNNPLFGVHAENGEINTSLPENVNAVEVGSTWIPASNLLLTASVEIESRDHSSGVAEFRERNYPVTFTMWYAHEPHWSVSAGYSMCRNSISQDITLGDIGFGPLPAAETSRWNYTGLSHVINMGSQYALSETVSFSGNVEFVTAENSFASPAPWPSLSGLPGDSDVNVQTLRYSAGIDWWVREGVTVYCRYNFFDYEDKSVDYNSGTANMFLGGFNALY